MNVYTTIDLLPERILFGDKWPDQFFDLAKINCSFLRVPYELRQYPSANARNRTSIHVIGIDFIWIMPATAIARDIINKATCTRNRETDAIVAGALRQSGKTIYDSIHIRAALRIRDLAEDD